ncbi:hypothetical protein PsYK624_148560 [Phanerochaete sordida]|uniref:Uncharacterized protein n=1 Tax=Phanerochaete sordida TaxID=48140 RepID=A0A9P3LLS9_9APHY|nr:hypothetical protein PsYK624_148560 [Phanerochaete sordida]
MAAVDGPTPIQVDDADLSITYSGGWFLGGNTAPGTEFDGTTHGATANGSRLAFTFDGTSVAVYGTISGAPTTPPSTSLFMVDNDFATAANVTPPQPPQPVYQHMWWSSGELSPGTHTLNVVAQNVQEGDLVWIDFVQYVPLPATSASASGTGLVLASGSAPTSSGSSSTAADPASSASTSSSSPTPSDTPALATTTHKTSHLGAILPAIIVPIALILLLLSAYVLWRRRKRTKPFQGSRESILGHASLSFDTPPETAFVALHTPASAPASLSAPPSSALSVSASTSVHQRLSLEVERVVHQRSLPTPPAVHRPFLADGAAHSKESVVLSYVGDPGIAGVVRHPHAGPEGEESPPAYVG